jgi:DNA-binding GntR family transcriptional regulator
MCVAATTCGTPSPPRKAALDPWEPRAYTGANVHFHEQLLHLSGNEFVVAQAPILRMTAQVFAPVALVEAASAERAIAEHRAITGAVEAADERAAERLAHIEAAIAQLKEKQDAEARCPTWGGDRSPTPAVLAPTEAATASSSP